MKYILFPLCFVLLNFTSHSTIHQVPSVYPTIQQALNISQPFDTVLVAPGIYFENLIWPSVNAIRLVGEKGADSTIINAGGNGRCIIVNSGTIDTLTIIQGFTLTGGYFGLGSNHGAGALISNASVLFEDIKITGNTIFRPGGNVQGVGLHMTNSNTVMRNSIISENKIDSAQWCYGAGVFIFGGSPQFVRVIISQNEARSSSWCYGVGIYARNLTAGRFEQVEVSGNYSGDNAIWYYGNGIYTFDVDAVFENVLIASNVSGTGGSFNYGGGIFCDGAAGNIQFMNVTVAGNRKTGNATINGSGVYLRDATITMVNSILYNPNTGSEIGMNSAAQASASYSNIRGGMAGMSNMDTLPGFISTADFHITLNSPLAGMGTDNGAPVIDLDGIPRPLPSGTMPDMGCYEVDQSLTSVSEIFFARPKIFAYPNPLVSGNVLFLEGISDKEVLVIDSSGRVLMIVRSVEDKLQLNTSGWAAGWYLVRSSNGVPVKVVVVN